MSSVFNSEELRAKLENVVRRQNIFNTLNTDADRVQKWIAENGRQRYQNQNGINGTMNKKPNTSGKFNVNAIKLPVVPTINTLQPIIGPNGRPRPPPRRPRGRYSFGSQNQGERPELPLPVVEPVVHPSESPESGAGPSLNLSDADANSSTSTISASNSTENSPTNILEKRDNYILDLISFVQEGIQEIQEMTINSESEPNMQSNDSNPFIQNEDQLDTDDNHNIPNKEQQERQEELKVDDKVVWFNGNLPENGSVKWIGELEGLTYAGVEFDKEIGNTSGIHKGIRYFTCRNNHGKFVQVNELMHFIDFYGEEKPLSTEPDLPESRSLNDTPFNLNVIICVICHDSLFIKQEDDDQKESELITTSCGHLYHRECLLEWLKTKPSVAQHSCPFCQRQLNIKKDIIRIFPVASF